MGAGSSTPSVGAQANPRVVYTDQLSKKERKNLVVDAPVLVDVQHGSIRYRYDKTEDENKKKARRVEKPHEGEDKTNKQGYFYHARMNDFTGKSVHKKNEPHKFLYVAQGPVSAKQKKVFYVYGFGLEATDGTKTIPSSTEAKGEDYAWPEKRKSSDVFYNLVFVKEDGESEDPNIVQQTEMGSIVTRLLATDSDTASDVGKKLAVTIQHAASDIHICFNKRKLQDFDIIAELKKEDCGRKSFFIDLVLF